MRIIIEMLPVVADYDVTGRTFPTGHMRVMPHTDMSALTLLFQRCGKPPRRCYALCVNLAPCSVRPWTQHPFPNPLTPFPLYPSLHHTGPFSPPSPRPLSPLLTLPCSGMILHAKGHHHKFCNNDFDCENHDTLVLVQRMETSIFQQVNCLVMG